MMSVAILDKVRMDRMKEELDRLWKAGKSAGKLQNEYDEALRRYASQVDDVEQKYIDYATAINFYLDEAGVIQVEIDNGD